MSVRQFFKSTSGVCVQGMFLFALGALAVPLSAAQEAARGTITGIVTDPQHLVVAGAHVKATNTATGVQTSTVTTAGGNYALLYLIPGTYSVEVEHAGFEKLVRPDIAVHVGDELKINLQLVLGNVKQEVTVKGGASALQTANADVGQTFDRQELSDLPLPDSNPFTLTQLVAGTVFTGNPKFSRPFDNGDVSAVRVNGAEGGNDFSLNGVPNNGAQKGSGNSAVAFQPPVDAIEDFKMTTSNFSATSGNTAAGSVNINTKSGTNAYHGTLYEFWRNDALAANDFFGNNTTPKQARAVVRYNHFGGTFGGPVRIPKLYNGQDKTFFFVAAEALPDTFPNRGFFTVPTLAERNGDLFALCISGFNSATGMCTSPTPNSNSGPTGQVYDPYGKITSSGGHITRTPFRFNRIPVTELNPISQAILGYYPLPDVPGKPDGTNNYISQNPRRDSFHSFLVRGDRVLSNSQKLSATYYQNWREEISGDYPGIINGTRPAGGDLQYENWGSSVDDTITLSPTTLLDIRAGWSLFADVRGATSDGFNPAKLGFSPAVTSLFVGRGYFPSVSINGFSGLGGNDTDNRRWNGYDLSPTVTKVTGNHIFTFGYEARLYRFGVRTVGAGEGAYTFNGDFARLHDNSTNNQLGQGLTDFLVGQPTTTAIDRNANRSNQGLYHALFIQDDWKLTPKLTLNLGLRWEYEGATTERLNRNVRGFDLNTPLPIQGAVQAAFNKAFPKGFQPFQAYVLANPTAPIPAALLSLPPITNLPVRGGYTFASPADRGFWNPSWLNFQPRFGVAYALDQHTVVRAGWAIYSVPFDSHGDLGFVNQAGFSQQTKPSITNNNGQTFLANLANPFPFGVVSPDGSTDGLFTDIGGGVTVRPTNVLIPKSQRWSFGIQRELPGQFVVDATYVGSHAYDLIRDQNSLDSTPAAFLSTSNLRDPTQTAIHSALTANVTNPFLGTITSTGLNVPSLATINTSSTISASQLLGAYPQFTSIQTPNYAGTNNFNAAEVTIQRRFTHGYGLTASYTWSKLLENFNFLNGFDTKPIYELSGNDIPQRLAMIFIGEVPFGHGRHWGANSHGWVEAILGGWQTQGIYQIQTGEPLGFGNLTYFGAGGCGGNLAVTITSCPVAYPTKLGAHYSGNTIGQGLPVFDISGFYIFDAQNVKNGQIDPTLQENDSRTQLENNVRTFPNHFGNLRAQGINNLDISLMKKIHIREGAIVEVRGEFLNAFNHPFFNGPDLNVTHANFGKVTGQRNLPREVQLGIKAIF